MFKAGQIVRLKRVGYWELKNGLKLGQTFPVITQNATVNPSDGIHEPYDLRLGHPYNGGDLLNSANFEFVSECPYKVGVKMRCMRQEGNYYDVGKIYTISDLHPGSPEFVQLDGINWYVSVHQFELVAELSNSRYLKFIGQSGDFLKTDEIYKVLDTNDTHYFFELPNGKKHKTTIKFAEVKFIIPSIAELANRFSEKKTSKYKIRNKTFVINEVNIL